MATLYDQLGVGPEASQDEIKRAYHRLARRHHPDAHSGADAAVLDEARRRMVAINGAWAVLGDPARRRAYDATVDRAPPPADEPGADGEAPWPEWFEPDGVAAADLEEDPPEEGRRGPGELVVFVPVALVALAVALFSFSLLSESPTIFGAAVALVPVALVAFLAMPLVVLLRGSRARPRD
ncbi:MAG TPA: J domain-containing protein [Acidimicrobiales bacterium]|nr:J domain-containing protein [Acidimicrobiales bacterium]